MASRFTRSAPVTVNDVLDGHVALDLACLDRLYLHGYLARFQVGGQVMQFLRHRGYQVYSPACLQQIGDEFRRKVASFAEANHIPVVPLNAHARNIEVMRPYLAAAAVTGRSQLAAIGVAQETQRVFIGRKRDTDPGCWTLNVPARPASLRIQSSSGSRTRRSPPTGGERQPCALATLGSRPWPVPCASACAPSPASPTGACAP
jgi:hypothetical protein